MSDLKAINPLQSAIFFILITSLLLSSCTKDDDPVIPDPTPTSYQAYIDHEYVKTYSLSSVQSLFSGLEFLYPAASELSQTIAYGVDIYKLEYKTWLFGDTVTASGLLCIPKSSGTEFPIICFQNGTNTAHAEAPSKDLLNPLFQYLHATASMGYIMLIPDYLGFGSSEQLTHPYMHKESTVASVEQMILAASEMVRDDLIDVRWDDDLYLLGYSQGGWATMSSHYYIAEESNLGFSVSASACGAGPYDLSVVQDFMFEKITYQQPVYMAYTAISYHSLGIVDNTLNEFFNEPFATNLPSYFQGQYTNGEINDLLNDTVAVLIAPGFVNGINTDPIFNSYRNSISNNSIHAWSTQEPIRIYHGTIDSDVPLATSEKVYDEFVSAGAENMVEYFPLSGYNHTTGMIPMAIDALIWFSELEGKSASLSAQK